MAEIINNLNIYIIAVGAILFVSVYASKISEKIGLPLLLIFLMLGMFLGSEGVVGIDFDNILGHQQKRLTIRLHEGLFDLPKVEAQVIFGGIIAAFAPKIADDVAAAHLPGRPHQDQGDDSGSLAADLIADIRTVQ